MRIVYLGSGEFGIECLNALARGRHDLVFLVTQPAQPAGRGQKPKPTPVAEWAAENNIPVIETPDVNSAEIIDQIRSFKPDLLVVIAFGQKVGQELVRLAPKGAINVHASLLPKYRGAAPINWAIINGGQQTGVSIITLAEKMDAGDIIGQAETQIDPDETAGELHDRLAILAAPLLIQTIDKIANGTAVYVKQDDSQATRAPKLKKGDGFLDFNQGAELLKRRILGLWPWPGASAMYVSKKTGKSLRVTIANATVTETTSAHLPAGTLDENLNLICGEGALRITEIKPEGARLMGFDDFVNGRATAPGDMFAKIEK
jgi:methionyl-tRNA formyltransferase